MNYEETLRALTGAGYIVQFALDPDPTHDQRYHVQLVSAVNGSQFLACEDSFEAALKYCYLQRHRED
mgnify:CR=1 FL=1